MENYFYVGQSVEAVVSHHQGAFKKGDRFKITSVIKRDCGCASVTVGIPSTSDWSRCTRCNFEQPSLAEWSFSPGRFRPLQERTISLSVHSLKLEPKKVLIQTQHLTTEQ
jgi:hypothetical protein